MAKKYQPTSLELQIIQDGLNASDSLRTIGNKVNCSEKTIKVIIEDYNLDDSTYNPREAHGKYRVKNLTLKELDEVISHLEDGVSMRKLSKMYKVSNPTLVRILKANNIDHTHYKRSSEKKFTLSESKLDDAKEAIAEGKTLKELASEVGVNRNTLSSYLKEEGVIGAPVGLTDEQIQFVIAAHLDGVYINQIASIMNLPTSDIQPAIDSSGHLIDERMKYNQTRRENRKDIDRFSKLLKWYDEYAITTNQQITSKEINFVLDNIGKLPFIEIVKDLGVDYKHLKRAMIILDNQHIFALDELLKSDYREEIISDLSIGAFSTPMLAKKYGSTASSVSTWRKNLHGDVKTYYTPSLSKSSFEMEFELLLHSLGIAFIPQYRIGIANFDYYIGHKTVIELQGTYWHKDSEEKDQMKSRKASEAGYQVMEIDEKDFYENRDRYKKEVLELYLNAIHIQYS